MCHDEPAFPTDSLSIRLKIQETLIKAMENIGEDSRGFGRPVFLGGTYSRGDEP